MWDHLSTGFVRYNFEEGALRSRLSSIARLCEPKARLSPLDTVQLTQLANQPPPNPSPESMLHPRAAMHLSTMAVGPNFAMVCT